MTLQNLFDEARAIMGKYGKPNGTIFISCELRHYDCLPDNPPIFEMKISAWMNGSNDIYQITSASPDILLQSLESKLISLQPSTVEPVNMVII